MIRDALSKLLDEVVLMGDAGLVVGEVAADEIHALLVAQSDSLKHNIDVANGAVDLCLDAEAGVDVALSVPPSLARVFHDVADDHGLGVVIEVAEHMHRTIVVELFDAGHVNGLRLSMARKLGWRRSIWVAPCVVRERLSYSESRRLGR